MHKKWSFPWRNCLVYLTKSAGGQIEWTYPYCKTKFFVQYSFYKRCNLVIIKAIEKSIQRNPRYMKWILNTIWKRSFTKCNTYHVRAPHFPQMVLLIVLFVYRCLKMQLYKYLHFNTFKIHGQQALLNALVFSNSLNIFHNFWNLSDWIGYLLFSLVIFR